MSISANEKNALISMHKLISTIDPSGPAGNALLQTLGKGLRDGAMTPDDVAEVVMGVFDERADKEAQMMGEVIHHDPALFVAALLSILEDM